MSCMGWIARARTRCLGQYGWRYWHVVPLLQRRYRELESCCAGAEKEYTIAALVQANYGAMRGFRVAGALIGRLIYEERRGR